MKLWVEERALIINEWESGSEHCEVVTILANAIMQFLDNSANYGLKRMADDRVDMSTILQKEHTTWNVTMTVTMTMLMIMTMTMTMTMNMTMTMTMTVDMTTFAIYHCQSHGHMVG